MTAGIARRECSTQASRDFEAWMCMHALVLVLSSRSRLVVVWPDIQLSIHPLEFPIIRHLSTSYRQTSNRFDLREILPSIRIDMVPVYKTLIPSASRLPRMAMGRQRTPHAPSQTRKVRTPTIRNRHALSHLSLSSIATYDSTPRRHPAPQANQPHPTTLHTTNTRPTMHLRLHFLTLAALLPKMRPRTPDTRHVPLLWAQPEDEAACRPYGVLAVSLGYVFTSSYFRPPWAPLYLVVNEKSLSAAGESDRRPCLGPRPQAI